jgi:hypothetical protein
MKNLYEALLVLLGVSVIIFSFFKFIMTGIIYIFIAILGIFYPEKFDFFIIGKAIGYIVLGSLLIGFILILFYTFISPSKWVNKSKQHKLPIERK